MARATTDHDRPHALERRKGGGLVGVRGEAALLVAMATWVAVVG
jgi:hypothetical protein